MSRIRLAGVLVLGLGFGLDLDLGLGLGLDLGLCLGFSWNEFCDSVETYLAAYALGQVIQIEPL